MLAKVVTPTLLVLAGLLGGCTAATFDPADPATDEDAPATDAGADAAGGEADVRAEVRPDGRADGDAGPDVGFDTAPGPDTAPTDTASASDTACPTRCAYSATGRFRLVDQSCTGNLDCCSDYCHDPTPGDGVPGVCQRAPGVDDTQWCGGAQEWCPDAAGTICRPATDGG